MESIHSPVKNPLPSRHERVYFKLARFSVLKMFKMFWMRNMRVRFQLAVLCSPVLHLNTQWSTKKLAEDWIENIYPVRSKTLGSIEMWSAFQIVMGFWQRICLWGLWLFFLILLIWNKAEDVYFCITLLMNLILNLK